MTAAPQLSRPSATVTQNLMATTFSSFFDALRAFVQAQMAVGPSAYLHPSVAAWG